MPNSPLTNIDTLQGMFSLLHQYRRVLMLLPVCCLLHLCGPNCDTQLLLLACTVFSFIRVCGTTSSGLLSTSNLLPSLHFTVISSSSLLTSSHCLIISSSVSQSIASLSSGSLSICEQSQLCFVSKELPSQNAA